MKGDAGGRLPPAYRCRPALRLHIQAAGRTGEAGNLVAEQFGVKAGVELVECGQAKIAFFQLEDLGDARQFVQFHAPVATLPETHGYGRDVHGFGDMRLIEAEFLAAAPQDLVQRHGCTVTLVVHKLFCA